MAISPSPLSPEYIAKLFKERCDDASVLLITVSHDSWDGDLLLSTSNKDLLYYDEKTHLPVGGFMSRGKEFLFVGMRVKLPNSSSEQAPGASIVFSNVGNDIAEKIKIVDVEYPMVKMEIITWNEPDDVEQEFTDLQAKSAGYNGMDGTLTLANDVMENDPTPGHTFNSLEWYGVNEVSA